ncbi:hypothetical protein C7S17_4206 [Burkholderia thailandensis]|nr:hypothetical protein [Burkholderia thailandensis]
MCATAARRESRGAYEIHDAAACAAASIHGTIRLPMKNGTATQYRRAVTPRGPIVPFAPGRVSAAADRSGSGARSGR